MVIQMLLEYALTILLNINPSCVFDKRIEAALLAHTIVLTHTHTHCSQGKDRAGHEQRSKCLQRGLKCSLF